MRSIKWVVALACLIGVGACGASPNATAPSPSSVRSNLVVASFGVLTPNPADGASQSEFASCLARARKALCFTAATMASPRFDGSNAQATSSIGRISAASVANGIPDPPSNLTFTLSPFYTVGTRNIVFSWQAPATSAAPTKYIIEAGSAPGLTDIASITTVNADTLYAPQVSGGGTFYVRVRSVGPGGTSAPSNEVIVTIADPRLPLAPCCLSVSTVGSTVTLSWSEIFSPIPVTNWVIQASSRPGGPADLANFVTGSTGTYFSATGVPPGTYYLRVLPANNFGIGPPSSEVTLIVVGPTPCTTAPSVPTNLVPLVNGSTVALGWSPVGTGTVTSYVIEAGSGPGLADLASADTGTTAGTATFTGVPRGTYYVRVRSKNACGASAGSTEVVVVVR